jgi:hypothetical protein
MDKVTRFFESEKELNQIERMERQNKIARLVNQINSEIERQTTEFHQQLCGYVCHVLDKEL